MVHACFLHTRSGNRLRRRAYERRLDLEEGDDDPWYTALIPKYARGRPGAVIRQVD